MIESKWEIVTFSIELEVFRYLEKTFRTKINNYLGNPSKVIVGMWNIDIKEGERNDGICKFGSGKD